MTPVGWNFTREQYLAAVERVVQYIKAGDVFQVNLSQRYAVRVEDSPLEIYRRLQQEFPTAHFVKAFNSVGSALMVNPQFKAGKPTMFICGNDESAKRIVNGVLEQFGWETTDMGKVEAARAIEPLCMLWCIPGLLRQEWDHAFKLLK